MNYLRVPALCWWPAWQLKLFEMLQIPLALSLVLLSAAGPARRAALARFTPAQHVAGPRGLVWDVVCGARRPPERVVFVMCNMGG